MKYLLAALLLFTAAAAWAQSGPVAPCAAAPGCRAVVPAGPLAARRPGGNRLRLAQGLDLGQIPTGPPNQARQQAVQQAAMGDLFGGRSIPPDILKVLGDPRIDPVTAYMVWQAVRRPLEEWTMRQLQEITTVLPTLAETGMPMAQVQALYKFIGLDPGDVFHPQLGQDWQDRSTQYDKSSSAAVAAISSADCQGDTSQMTVATFQSCMTGGP
jgi:hypothetical protein